MLIQNALREADLQLIADFKRHLRRDGMHHFFQAIFRVALFLEWRLDKLPDWCVISGNVMKLRERYNLNIVISQRFADLVELWKIVLWIIDGQTIGAPAPLDRSVMDHPKELMHT